MEAWDDLYVELSTTIKEKLPEVEWVDLWHDQVAYLTDELPFPTPALFLSFNTLGCDDKGLLIQDCDTQIDMYLFYETFSDTYQGSYNQGSALEFLRTLTKIHQTFHGKSGVNYGTLRRVGMGKEESGGAGNLYRISFGCVIEDSSAKVDYPDKPVSDIVVESSKIERPKVIDDNPLFIVDAK